MGSNFAKDLASGTAGVLVEQAIRIHLTSNHYPPVPVEMVGPCMEAIQLGYVDDTIELPEGVEWRGNNYAPAYAIIDNYHLDAFLDEGDEG